MIQSTFTFITYKYLHVLFNIATGNLTVFVMKIYFRISSLLCKNVVMQSFHHHKIT